MLSSIKRRKSFSNESSSTASAVSYDSDDEMVRSSRSESSKIRPLSRISNKKGHPIYSSEEIREQYCINSKELDFFEEGAFERNNLFGCLSSSNLLEQSSSSLPSSCNKSSFIPNCVRRINFGITSSSAHDKKPKGGNRRRKKERKAEDADDSDGGFKKQRPKPKICFIESQNKLSPARGHFSPPPTYGSHGGGSKDQNQLQDQRLGAESIAPSSLNQKTLSHEGINQNIRPQNICSFHQDTGLRPSVCGQCRSPHKESSVRFCIKPNEERRRSSGGSSNRWPGGHRAQVAPVQVGTNVIPGRVQGIQQIRSGQYVGQYTAMGGQLVQQGMHQQPINLQPSHYHHHCTTHHDGMRLVSSSSISPVPSIHSGQHQYPVASSPFMADNPSSICPIHRCPSGQSNVILPPFDPVNNTFARYYYYYKPLNSRVSGLL